MLAAVFAVASAFAAASETTSSLSKEDLCQLVVLAARKEFVAPPHHTNLLAQSATSDLAGDHGRIWMDVGVTEHGRSRSPLARGESCGDPVLVELCDWERQGSCCSRDRKDRERWRVLILLTVVDPNHVESTAVLAKPVRQHGNVMRGTVSPVPAFHGQFERAEGGWRELAAAPLTRTAAPDAGPRPSAAPATSADRPAVAPR